MEYCIQILGIHSADHGCLWFWISVGQFHSLRCVPQLANSIWCCTQPHYIAVAIHKRWRCLSPPRSGRPRNAFSRHHRQSMLDRVVGESLLILCNSHRSLRGRPQSHIEVKAVRQRTISPEPRRISSGEGSNFRGRPAMLRRDHSTCFRWYQ